MFDPLWRAATSPTLTMSSPAETLATMLPEAHANIVGSVRADFDATDEHPGPYLIIQWVRLVERPY
jgi:hypothetical protein